MTPGFGYAMAFATGILGAFHCIGMCSGIAGGFFVHHGLKNPVLAQLRYHGTRILVYTVLGTSGAFLGRVLVQSGAIGKGQGLLLITAGMVVTLIGARRLGLLPSLRHPERHTPGAGAGEIRFADLETGAHRWTPAAAGLVNGLVPCSLVFSVAVKAVGSADPFQAGLLMIAFGLGTLPTMAAVTTLGAVVGGRARGIASRLAGLTVMALGIWTLYEGLVFYDVMRGLSG